MSNNPKNLFLVLLLLSGPGAFAQLSNGKVNSLVAAENYFVSEVAEKGIKAGFRKVSDEETLIFRPLPVKAVDYFDRVDTDSVSLVWEPVYARISKSGDWGFTTGPSIYTDSTATQYGQYLSVWKTNRRGVWKLALDIGISHPKPKRTPQLDFRDPENTRYQRTTSPGRLKQRVDLILTTDRLYATTRRMNPDIAFNDFFTPQTRVLFPGNEPIIGSANIAAFFKKNGINVHSEVTDADRSLGSDLAYTYGTATVSTKDSAREYSYVRIWENVQGRWNILIEAYAD